MAKMASQRTAKGRLIRRRQGYAVTRAAACNVTAACPAAALCEGGKTLPFAERRRGRFDNFEEF